MSDYCGDIKLGDTLQLKFTMVGPTGAPTQLAGTPVVSAYPTNNPVQITAGITLTVDFDGVTGLNHVTVVASAGNGYLAGTDYTLVITQGTVGGTPVVGYDVASFSIQNRTASLVDAMWDVDQSVHLIVGSMGYNATVTAAAVNSILVAIGNGGDGLTALPPVALTGATIDAILDDPIGDGAITVRQALRVVLAILAGKLSGAATPTVTIRNLADSANVAVVTADVDGNRTAVVVTP